jgi:hypothetical protein
MDVVRAVSGPTGKNNGPYEGDMFLRNSINFCQITRSHIPEDISPYIHHPEYLKSHKDFIFN